MLENEYLMQVLAADRRREARAVARRATLVRDLARDGITYRNTRALDIDKVVALYRANHWSSADKPRELRQALRHAHTVVTAWAHDELVGLGSALADGALVVYYPHLLVRPDYQRRGIGREIARRLMTRYAGYHQHVLVADGDAVHFYRRLGFQRAGRTEPMWIYAGREH
jgi:ribosomal protein S18 acetylase RimI-like enzyme